MTGVQTCALPILLWRLVPRLELLEVLPWQGLGQRLGLGMELAVEARVSHALHGSGVTCGG